MGAKSHPTILIIGANYLPGWDKVKKQTLDYT